MHNFYRVIGYLPFKFPLNNDRIKDADAPKQPLDWGWSSAPMAIPTPSQPNLTACCSALPWPYSSPAVWNVRSAAFWKSVLLVNLSRAETY